MKWFLANLEPITCYILSTCSYCFLIKATDSTGKYLPAYFMEESPSSEANWFSASQEISPHFIELEASLPHSQVPITWKVYEKQILLVDN